MAGAFVGWLGRQDPEWYAMHKAIKVAVAVTAGVAIGTLLGNAQLTMFAAFGGVAYLLFADFPGSRSARFGAYLGLYAIGAVLICLGTLASNIPWVAVLGMGVVGFLVLFSGVLSAAAASATRAALLSFILPVTVPGPAPDMLSRVAGWSLAALLAVPLAVVVWPPMDHRKLRQRGATACAALAAQLTARGGGNTADAPEASAAFAASSTFDSADHSEVDHAAQQAIHALRRQFRSTTFRPVGLTSGSRVLMQLTDRLEWLYSVARRIPVTAAHSWPAHTVESADSVGGVAVHR